MMRETNQLEFKESITNTFLKTVSAFANYSGGDIIFGIDDQGNTKGIDDLESARLSIENKINDSIEPQPSYTITIQETEKTILLHISEGESKPYYYKSKAYKRNDTSTIEVDSLELSRLILQGQHTTFESLQASNQTLAFTILEAYLKKYVEIEALDNNILKTLNLYTEAKGFNHAAELLADNNSFPGIDIVKFGENISILQKRLTLEHQSVLKIYEEAMKMFDDYYCHEEIIGAERKQVERIPRAAFRETVANALIHRSWDVNSHIRILMFDDHIEVVSPGGLPPGITKDEYLSGKISMLRNYNLAQVFYRLNIVEIFGTGILRIKHLYSESISKPQFEVMDHSITVSLPVVDTLDQLSADEKVVYQLLSKTMNKSIGELTPYVEFGRSKVASLLKSMAEKGVIAVEGRGRGTKYHK